MTILVAQNHDVFFDVIIIGAGLAGLRAAHELIAKHGLLRHNILILEAQDYIGGRVRQAEDFVPNGLIELGAEILHGELTLLTEFAKEQGEEIKPIYCWAHGDGGPMEEPVDGGYGMYYLADSQRLLRFDTTDPDFQHLNQTLRLLPHLHPEEISTETSLKDFLSEKGVSDEMLRLGRSGYANTSCGDLDTISLKQIVTFSRQWETEGEGDGDFKYVHTFKCLMDYLKQQVQDRVLLNYPVKSVTRHPALASVSVEAVDGRMFKAKRVIVTSSIHVLQRPELLTFNPPLPTHYTSSIQHAVMQPAMKIFMQFSAAFWPVGLQGMIMAPPAEEEAMQGNQPYYYVPECWFNVLPCAQHAHCYNATNLQERHHVAGGCRDCNFYCVGFVTSQFAQNLDKLPDDEQICDVLVNQLDRVFNLLKPQHWLLPEQHERQVRQHMASVELSLPAAPPSATSEATLESPLSSSSLSSSSPSVSSSPPSTSSVTALLASVEGKAPEAVAPPHAPAAASTVTSSCSTSECASETGDDCLPLPSRTFLKGRVQRWTSGRHPYIGGGYASAVVHTDSNCQNQKDKQFDYARIYGERGVDDVLFFAGEGVNYPAGGTAHAALESGVRVATMVAASLAPLSTTTSVAMGVVDGSAIVDDVERKLSSTKLTGHVVASNEDK